MAIYFEIVLSLYVILLLLLYLGWSRATIPVSTPLRTPFISVVIAVRNEAKHLGKLLGSITSLDYPLELFEVILVDDHSTDDSAAIIKDNMREWGIFSLIPLQITESGKKSALTRGIHQAKGEIIVTTDADCIVPPQWLRGVSAGFQNPGIMMLVGGIRIEGAKSFFTHLQSLEFTSIMGSGIASLGLGFPILCNGANLAYRKSAFLQVNGYEGNLHIPSGDDEFLMRKLLKTFPRSIQFLNDQECVVTTGPQDSLKEFFHQRLRWAAKWKHNDSPQAKGLAVFIWLVQISWISLLVIMILHPNDWGWCVILSKMIVEALLLNKISRYLRQPFQWISFALLQLTYAFYVICIGFVSQIGGYHWKGRNFHTL